MGIYSEVIYESKVSRLRHPDYVATLSFLLGGPRCEITKARVLNVGCGTGRHLVPLAWEFPEATLVGIDPEPAPLQLGRDLGSVVGVKNLTLVAGYLDELRHALAFDIVLVHGVFSWIEPTARITLLKELAAIIRPGGIVVISHNVLPGWRLRQLVRDCILSHPRYDGTLSPQDQLPLVRELLSNLSADLVPQQGYGSLLSTEVARLRREPDHYLCHELLNPIADGTSLLSFTNQLAKHGLHYLGDSLWTRMVTKTSAALPFGEAREAMFTWNDFSQGEAFRESIFTTSGTPLAHGELSARLRHCSFAAYLNEVAFNSRSLEITAEDLAEKSHILRGRAERAVAKALTSHWPRFVPWHELQDLTSLRAEELSSSVELLLRRDLIMPSLNPPRFHPGSMSSLATFPWLDRPEAGPNVISGLYNTIEIGGFETTLLSGIKRGHCTIDSLAHFIGGEMARRGASEIPSLEELRDATSEGVAVLYRACLLRPPH